MRNVDSPMVKQAQGSGYNDPTLRKIPTAFAFEAKASTSLQTTPSTSCFNAKVLFGAALALVATGVAYYLQFSQGNSLGR